MQSSVPSKASGGSETAAMHLQAVERVVEEMGRRLYDGFTLDEMADVAVMSPYHFNRVFRRTSGIPPGQFFGALRLQEAKRLLLQSDLSVTEVCFEVGYNSLGTFTRRFGDLVGLSPGRFRDLDDDEPDGEAGDPLDWLRRPRALHGPEPELLGVSGRVTTPADFSGPVFVGLFADAIPQSRPVACTVLSRPGRFHLRSLPDGRYHLFAASLDWSASRRDLLLCGEALRGTLDRPLVLRDGRAVGGEVELSLRPPGPIDPPLLLTLPVLIRERVEVWRRQVAGG